MVRDNQRRKGKEGLRHLSERSLTPVNRITLQDFDTTSDVIDLTHLSQIASRVDLAYLTNPLTFFLPDNQKIVLSNYKTMNDLTDENFLFLSSLTSSSPSSEVSMSDLSVIIPVFASMIALLLWLPLFSSWKKDDEGKTVKKIGIEDQPSDHEINDMMEAIREEIDHHEHHAISMNHNHCEEVLAEMSSSLFGDIISSEEASIREYDDEESLLTLSLQTINHSNEEQAAEDASDHYASDFLATSSSSESEEEL